MPKRLASQPAKRLIAAAIALAILAGPAAAQYIQIGAMNPAYSPLNPLTPAQRNQLILQGRNAELQANQRVQQGLQYQQNQQIYRQLDRSQSQQIYGQLDRSRPQPRLDSSVPRMKPTCMKKIFGNKFVQMTCPSRR